MIMDHILMKGKLKLSVYINCGLLTIHVVQAKELSPGHGEICDAFTKLSLAPDESRRTRCKTAIVSSNNNPKFDEKFSFELLEEDMKKRLLVSAWTRNPIKGRSDLLGCMSFGVQHIKSQKKVINGWYYLLSEQVGRTKHLQVSTKKPQLAEIPHRNIPKVNQDLLWMEPHSLLIRRGHLGYGFSFTGCSPVRICSVMPGSWAEDAGMKKDDCVVRVNGTNVSRSTAQSIARIVRQSPDPLLVEVQRPREATARRRQVTSTPRYHHPHTGAHSDSELEDNVRTKLSIRPTCGSLPRRKVAFKNNAG